MKEGVIYCDLKMDMCIVAKGLIDCVGQYSRPDVMSLTVDNGKKEHARCVSKQASETRGEE